MARPVSLLYRLYERRLLRELDKSVPVPRHVGVITDGNRRWAKEFGATTADGHRAGAEKIDHEVLLISILSRLIPAYRELVEYGDVDFSSSTSAAAVRENMVTLGTRVRVERPDGTNLYGQATGLDSGGDLIIDDKTVVSAGDVHHLRNADEGNVGASSAEGSVVGDGSSVTDDESSVVGDGDSTSTGFGGGR